MITRKGIHCANWNSKHKERLVMRVDNTCQVRAIGWLMPIQKDSRQQPPGLAAKLMAERTK